MGGPGFGYGVNPDQSLKFNSGGAPSQLTSSVATAPKGDSGGSNFDVGQITGGLGIVGQLVDMILNIKSAVGASKQKSAADSQAPAISQTNMQIPMLGR